MSLLFGSLWVSGGALAGFIGVMLMIGLIEYYTTLRHKGYTPLVIFGYLGAIGCLAGTWVWGPDRGAGGRPRHHRHRVLLLRLRPAAP